MTFEELLDQAIALLQRRGRVTYRTLKRQFQLDDDVLADLQEELIYGQRLAVDEDGRVLPQDALPRKTADATGGVLRGRGVQSDQDGEVDARVETGSRSVKSASAIEKNERRSQMMTRQTLSSSKQPSSTPC